MGQDESKCTAMIELKGDDEIVYNVEGVKEMIRNGPAKRDTKIFVICISGVYRSGKSFLLNLLKTYLDHYCEHSTDVGWAQCGDTRIKGGSWAQGTKIVTRGIQMYMYPKLINETGFILMDCQGARNVMMSTPTLDNLILFLGLQLSDVHILNVDRSLRADDLDRLDVCVYCNEDDSRETLFERQMFLIRNWGLEESPHQLETLIEKSSSESVKSTAEGIKKAFKAVEIETLPPPGEGLDGSSESDNICVGDVDAKFLKKASELFHRLIQIFPSEVRMSSAGFISLFELLSKRDVGKIRSPEEVYEESMVKSIYIKSLAHFKSEVEKFQSGKQGNMTTEQVEERVPAIYEVTERMFNEDKRVRKCKNLQVTTDYLAYLKKEYEQTLEIMESTFEVERLNQEVQKKKEEFIGEVKQSVEVEPSGVKGHMSTTEEATQNVAGTNSDVELQALPTRLDAVELGEANNKSQTDSIEAELQKQMEANAQIIEMCCQLESALRDSNQRIQELETDFHSRWNQQREALRSVLEKQEEMETMMTELRNTVEQPL